MIVYNSDLRVIPLKILNFIKTIVKISEFLKYQF